MSPKLFATLQHRQYQVVLRRVVAVKSALRDTPLVRLPRRRLSRGCHTGGTAHMPYLRSAREPGRRASLQTLVVTILTVPPGSRYRQSALNFIIEMKASNLAEKFGFS